MNMKAKSGLGLWHYEDQLIQNLRKTLSEHLLFNHNYLKAYERGIILKFYDDQIERENIIKLYPHPIEEFTQALVTGKLITLMGKSSSQFKTKKPV